MQRIRRLPVEEMYVELKYIALTVYAFQRATKVITLGSPHHDAFYELITASWRWQRRASIFTQPIVRETASSHWRA